jgi:lycopene beta-cyclase
MAATHICDVAIVGGGLSGCLFALALHERRPDARLLLIESGPSLGGNHLWSFFASDLSAEERRLVAPLVVHAWTGYDVAFPGLTRHLDTNYYSITSERLDAVVRGTLPRDWVLTGRKALAASPTTVVLANGDRVEAGGVIDCRGAGDLTLLEVGWQKFLGQELLLEEPHAIPHPTIMDATVEQLDGYRFVYTLPTAATRVFIEDTYYSDTRRIDRAVLGERIADYAAGLGLAVRGVAREETGSLPVVIGGDFEAYWRSGGNKVAKGGVRAGLFHPTTSYSLPDAVRAARLVAGTDDLSGTGLHDLLHAHAAAAWRERGFYRMLDAMLFRAADPAERWRVLARFYALDERLIGRFYAAGSTLGDKARLLAGKPPVPIGRAIAAIRGSGRGVERG